MSPRGGTNVKNDMPMHAHAGRGLDRCGRAPFKLEVLLEVASASVNSMAMSHVVCGLYPKAAAQAAVPVPSSTRLVLTLPLPLGTARD